jgi:hypothetical protein
VRCSTTSPGTSFGVDLALHWSVISTYAPTETLSN